jgi:hypothetical protein
MNLIFERGTRESPSGHALVYFRTGDTSVFASYILVPPISFDPTDFTPPALAPLLQGLDLSSMTLATPMPPIPQEVPNQEYLQALAERRNDDLVFAGNIVVSSVAMLMPEIAEAASQYGELYKSSVLPDANVPAPAPAMVSRFAGMTEGEKINQLTSLTGQLRDAASAGRPDTDIVDGMRELIDGLPAKYRVSQLIKAAQIPGERGQRLAGLYLERCYKLLHEEYLDLERIDREIEALED